MRSTILYLQSPTIDVAKHTMERTSVYSEQVLPNGTRIDRRIMVKGRSSSFERELALEVVFSPVVYGLMISCETAHGHERVSQSAKEASTPEQTITRRQ